jgi:hypothetical protein
MRKLLYIITLFFSVLFTLNTFAKVDSDEPETVDNSIVIDRITNDDIIVSMPSLIFAFKDVDIKLKFKDPQHTKLLLNKNKINFIINGEEKELTFVNGEAIFTHKFDKSRSLSIYVEDFSYSTIVTAYPIWAILVPLAFILLWFAGRMMKKKKE